MLHEGDKTPIHWVLPKASISERLKKPLRRVLYPPYLKLIKAFLQRRYAHLINSQVDQWYWGTRGQEYEALRSQLQQHFGIAGKSVMIAGCGTGRDIPTWLHYRPSKLVGVDYFNYQRAWESMIRQYGTDISISFMQSDLGNLAKIKDRTFDIVGSDAVFEHVKNLPEVLQEFHRILAPGGALYATFGPLWYCWSGDHISGFDGIASGYNHLVLEQDAYERYLDSAGEFSHSEHDGRTWIKHGLFSYLRPREYLAALNEAGFEKVHLGVVLEPRAIQCFKVRPELKSELLKTNDESDLIVAGMSLIFRKVIDQG